MAMAIAQPDNFSSPSLTPVEELLQSTALAAGITRTSNNSMVANGSSSSSSSSTSSEDAAGQSKDDAEDDGPVLARLLSNRDLFPMILGYLDTRSLLSLASISARFRREILMPATPNLCCLNQFLQQRTVVCPMAQFESLKDFMVKYRSFKPLHLHFTYSERSSLMSLVPENTAPIYNSKQDATFSHPSSSPLTSSHLFGVNQSISINISSANSLYQHHHPLAQNDPLLQLQQQQQQPQLPLRLQHTQHENDQPETTSSYASSNTSSNTINTSANNNNNNSNSNNNNHDNNTNTNSTTQQHAAINRLKSMRTSSSSSTDSALSDSCESSGEGKGPTSNTRTVAESETRDEGTNKTRPGNNNNNNDNNNNNNNSIINNSNDFLSKTAQGSIDTPVAAIALQQQQQQQQQQKEQREQQQEQQKYPSQSVDYYRTSSSSGSNNPTMNNTRHYPNHFHSGLVDPSSSSRSESIPVHSSSLTATIVSPPIPGGSHSHGSQGGHGFELSYWQKFALNELFMRLLPFLKTLTIGRIDKPSKRARTQDPNRGNGELSAGVCFFLARCFNVMHDMPDTALESVVWMDVTVKDVALLVTMIELRDIMVDERYWKRGYWATDRPTSRDGSEGRGPGDQEDPLDDCEDDEDDWDGFYYLINQETGIDKKQQQQEQQQQQQQPQQQQQQSSSSQKKTLSSFISASAGKMPQRKLSNIKGASSAPSTSSTAVSSSSQFSKQTIAPLPQRQQISGLGHLVKNASSSSGSGATQPSSSASSSATTTATAAKVNNPSSNRNNDRNSECRNARSTIPPPAAWQGFGDGASSSDASVMSAFFAEEELHPAVQLYESLKAEIADAAFVSRTLNKGKRLATALTPTLDLSSPWVYEEDPIGATRSIASVTTATPTGIFS